MKEEQASLQQHVWPPPRARLSGDGGDDDDDMDRGDWTPRATTAPFGHEVPSVALASRRRARWLIWVQVEIMGPQKCEIVGKSQSVLSMINAIIFTRTRTWPLSWQREFGWSKVTIGMQGVSILCCPF
jgi:hypothetical protein